MTRNVCSSGFGSMLRELRERSGLTQQQLADFSMVSVRGIRNLEHGHARKPRKETIRLIADGLRLNSHDRRVFEKTAILEGGADGLDGDPDSAETPGFVSRSPLVGREAEVESLVDTLVTRGHRLVTVTGLPGVGKSHLVLGAMEKLHAVNGHSVFWTSHSQPPPTWCVSEPVSRVAELAQRAAVGLGQPGGTAAHDNNIDELAGALRRKRALMVVDGVRPRTLKADHVGRLLKRCPELTILATSTDTQSVPMEHAVHLAPLPLPRRGGGGTPQTLESAPSMSFFMRQVRALGAETAVRERFADEVARICHALDGLPGAMESAATWLPLLGPSELADLAEREPLTVLSPLSSDMGQSCVRDALESSVDQLQGVELRALRQMCGEPGSRTIEQIVSEEKLLLVERARIMRRLSVLGLVRKCQWVPVSSFEPLHLVRATLARHGTAPSSG